MKIILGYDDKTKITKAVEKYLEMKGYKFEVVYNNKWPEVAKKVGELVASGKFDQGILLCWTGTGTSIVANKVGGVRAALVWEPWIARGARKWNDANVLVMSSKRTNINNVKKILDSWFKIKIFDESERNNIDTLKKMDDYE